jgi:hypothetical protein
VVIFTSFHIHNACFSRQDLAALAIGFLPPTTNGSSGFDPRSSVKLLEAVDLTNNEVDLTADR